MSQSSLPQVPIKYVCFSCKSVGDHWITECLKCHAKLQGDSLHLVKELELQHLPDDSSTNTSRSDTETKLHECDIHACSYAQNLIDVMNEYASNVNCSEFVNNMNILDIL
eukprot:133306_1